MVKIPAGSGEHIFTLDIPAGGIAVAQFTIEKGQKLSSFRIHKELTNKDLSALEARLSTTADEDGVFATASGRQMGSNQPHLNHSDSGVSNSLNVTAVVTYSYLLSAPDGQAHSISVGYQNGGV